MFAEPHLKTRRVGEFSKVMQTLDYVLGLDNCLEFSQPFSCLDEAMQTRKKVLYCLTDVPVVPDSFSLYLIFIDRREHMESSAS